MSITSDQVRSLYDADVYSDGDEKIGSVGTVYLDDDTDRPSWVTVKTGLFGSSESFVPLDAATLDGDRVRVPYSKDKVKDAPRMDSDAELSPAEEDELYRHYGLAGGTAGTTDRDTTDQGTADRGTAAAAGTATGTVGTGAPGHAEGTRDAPAVDGTTGTGSPGYAEGGTRGEGHDTSGPNTDDAMTRSEERVSVGTQSRESGRARLRKHVVTERVTQDVPVSHEEVVVDREPITDANRGDAVSGGDLTEEEHEVTLHEERAVVDKETVPVERVRLGTQTVTGTESVSTDARREEIEVDGDGDGTTRSDDADRR
ncbi:PRC and DUF2382 domain-containing protein [Pseudokineococcus basanitobsidens]|uniref:PRC and DUF2382 domain-containing protein n=1 Tax=Pseudokineococcus basanitobsidens TaxID=1926649 RepID=A0ABU8RMY2_9ACTN